VVSHLSSHTLLKGKKMTYSRKMKSMTVNTSKNQKELKTRLRLLEPKARKYQGEHRTKCKQLQTVKLVYGRVKEYDFSLGYSFGALLQNTFRAAFLVPFRWEPSTR
jgi:hypothetical protein